MVRLQEGLIGKKPYYNRQKQKYGSRGIFIILAFVFCLAISQKVQWKGSSSLAQNNSNEIDEEEKDVLEHQQAGYLKPTIEPDQTIPDSVWDGLPTKSVYYMVVRNEKLGEARAVIRSMEDNMKNGTRYPWVLLNNQHFSMDFRKYIQRVTRSPVFFGKIDPEAWEYPEWIDIPRAENMMMEQEYSDVYNSARLSYHQLLRYQSGFFFHHPLFRKVEYTWRVEPGADYSCKMKEDLFLLMKEQQKKLGFVITMKESQQSIPTLWSRVNEFKKIYPQHILDRNSTIHPWIYNEREDDYNYCHFWSNFQLADLSFFRSEAYQKYFEYLDKTGNFFYER
ncbi:glycosyl transferase [Sporodiniella umbellata]|nr:glycosyl transferase [Sporodiniella umbellata]